MFPRIKYAAIEGIGEIFVIGMALLKGNKVYKNKSLQNLLTNTKYQIIDISHSHVLCNNFLS